MTDEPRRPDPDALLAQVQRAHRGRLKVFLGAAPGVGKTFEMLAEARRRRAGGEDVVAGLIESHGRAETEAAIGNLPVLPRARINYRGQTLEEFDLDAALSRRPAILLVDELAHTNAPGCRHPKRWQDVDELRRAGIEVWTTMNVQHLESLGEAVARITGVRVAETVPDQVLAEADAVELIDLPPAELIERMRQGRIYRADQAQRAMRGFFREGNLAALRELALRRTAERVDSDVTQYMRANAIAGPWPTGERVMALVGSDPASEGVVREARRIADALKAKLLVLHVETFRTPDGDPDTVLRLAGRLGAAVETVVARDVPSAVLAHAAAENVTHLVMGRGRSSLWRRLSGRTLSGILLRRAGDFTLHLVPLAQHIGGRGRRAARALPPWLGWAAAPLLVAAATAVAFGLDGSVPDGAFGMVYLVPVVASAVLVGPAQGVLAAILAFAAWNFLFLSPRHTLVIATPQDVLGIAVFTAVALLLAGTTGGLGRSVRAAKARMLGLRRLVQLSRRLGAAQDRGELLEAITEEAARLVGGASCVLLPLPPALGTTPGQDAADLVVRATRPIDIDPDAASLAAARWAMANARPAGHGTDTLPSVAWQFHPMRTARGVVGLVGVQLGGTLDSTAERALEALIDQAAVALERQDLMEERAIAGARAETEALRTALLTSLGHDLRTPLTSIRGAISTLRSAGPALSEATRADLLAAAEEETVRLGNWLNNILDIVRIEGGQIMPRRETLDVGEALQDVAHRLARQTGRPVEVAAPPGPAAKGLDPALLHQVLGNLLENALKFSGPDGHVSARARNEGGDVEVAIEDDGPGIPAADLPRVFDPFYRASRTDRVTAGSGLGLAIAQGLTQAMGGRIAAQSPIANGRGTRISLRFPAA
jgi:two-component system, OmpR family, sensor histidine kinase KdpD